jgi:hypothetical protein
MQADQAQEIDGLVKKIWETQIKKDYDKCLVWEESMLRSAFYYHMRERMKNRKTLKDLVLYPEMRVRSQEGENLRIDLAVVKMECDDKKIKTSQDCEKKWKNSGSCITRLLAAFEFKHWDREYPKAVQTELGKIKKYYRGVYYADVNSERSMISLEPELTYLGVMLDKGHTAILDKDRTTRRKTILGKRGEHSDVRLLLGVDLGKNSEFRHIEPTEDH